MRSPCSNTFASKHNARILVFTPLHNTWGLRHPLQGPSAYPIACSWRPPIVPLLTPREVVLSAI